LRYRVAGLERVVNSAGTAPQDGVAGGGEHVVLCAVGWLPVAHAAEGSAIVFADRGYAGDKLKTALGKLGRWALTIVKRAADADGFQVLPHRWVVERTLAWLNRNRRLAKDFEASIASVDHDRQRQALLATPGTNLINSCDSESDTRMPHIAAYAARKCPMLR
jgi:transposase